MKAHVGLCLFSSSSPPDLSRIPPSTQTLMAELKGHEDAVQTVQFDPSDKFLISGSSDSTFRVWSF